MPDSNDDFDLPRWHTANKHPDPAYFYPQNSINDNNPSLARSASFTAPTSSSRPRRDSDSAMARPPQSAFYPQFHPQQNQDPYSEMYYPQKTARSPMRVPNTPILDPYSQQNQYSPNNQFAYPNPPQQYAHNRNLSHPKHEPATPPIPATYSSPPSAHPGASQSHLSAQGPSRAHSISNPSTPMSFMAAQQSPGPSYYSQDQQMAVDPSPKRRASGFRRVRTVHDLQPRVENINLGRRVSAEGTYLSPLRQLTTGLVETYHICNPQFRYESAHNPRRVLTKPSKAAHNDGYDNEDYDYILYVNDWLGTEEGHKYLILDILGQGTFGQVVKCQNMKTHEIVAVKVVKNKPAYFNQSMMEVTILELLNKNFDPTDEHHILRLRDSFIHRNHLCLVFELLSSNLYELIKQNQFQGLSTQLVKVFMAQLLDALTVLKDARLIHCDLKPENILLKSLQSPQIKVIDFGSACHERQTVYTYIQSRFYRSPEVLLGMSYTASIDMWSLGCIAVELFLGLPLFPGTSEYNQLTRIIEMLGMPPMSMLNTGKQVSQFFDSYEVWNSHTSQNERKYKLKSMEQYSREHGTNEQPGKQYFKATTLQDIINTAPMPQVKSSRSSASELEKEMANRAAFIDFCQGLLTLNPVTRWTPQQARLHPFITGEKFTKPFVPDNPIMVSHHIQPGQVADPKRPYGGLVPSQPKGQRAYHDAAAYNHQLAQHQAYTTQAATQAANTTRNPYMVPHPPPQPHQQYQQHPQQHGGQAQAPPPPPQQPQQPSSAPQYQTSQDVNMVGVGVGGLGGYQSQQMHSHSGYGGGGPGPQGRQPLTHQSSAGQLGSGGGPGQGSQYGAPPPGAPPQAHLSPGSGSSTSSGASNRARANTINQMDAVPPALARLQHMNQDVIGGRNALTPVLNRDDAMREWERRQQGGKTAQVPAYPQLEYLQQQAEMAITSGAAMGGNTWATIGPAVGAALGLHPAAHGGLALNHAGHRYPPPQPSKLSHSYHPPQATSSTPGGPGSAILVDDDTSTGVGPPTGGGSSNASANARRDAILSNVRTAARGDTGPPPGQSGHQPQTPSSGGSSGGMYGGGGGAIQPSSSMNISSPPQAYTGNMTVTGNRYTATYGGPPLPPSSTQQQNHQQQQNQHPQNPGSASSNAGVFDSIDRRADLGNMFVPMQPDNYHQQPPQASQPLPQHSQPSQYAGGAGVGGGGPRGHVVPPQQAVPTSFYGAGVVPSGVHPSSSQGPLGSGGPPPPQPGGGQGQQGGQRNPFTSMPVPDPAGSMTGVGMGVGVGLGGMSGKPQDVRRGNGMDAWPR